MEKYLLNSPNVHEETEDSLLAEKVLNKALLDFRRKKLQEEIDKTLSDRNKQEFMRLTEVLKSIS